MEKLRAKINKLHQLISAHCGHLMASALSYMVLVRSIFGSGQHTALDPVSGFPKPWERRRRVRSLLLQAASWAPTVGEKDATPEALAGATRLGRSPKGASARARCSRPRLRPPDFANAAIAKGTVIQSQDGFTLSCAKPHSSQGHSLLAFFLCMAGNQQRFGKREQLEEWHSRAPVHFHEYAEARIELKARVVRKSISWKLH